MCRLIVLAAEVQLGRLRNQQTARPVDCLSDRQGLRRRVPSFAETEDSGQVAPRVSIGGDMPQNVGITRFRTVPVAVVIGGDGGVQDIRTRQLRTVLQCIYAKCAGLVPDRILLDGEVVAIDVHDCALKGVGRREVGIQADGLGS